MNTSKSSAAILSASMMAIGFVGLVNAIPEPLVCGPVGSSSTMGPGGVNPNRTHNYDGDTAGILTVVYNQCLDPTSPSSITDDEWAAGIDGAFYNSASVVTGANAPANDLFQTLGNPWDGNTYAYTASGGLTNCVGAAFTGHHGGDEFINTQDAVELGNIRVFVTADQHDDPGEQAYNAYLDANGGIPPTTDPRDPCGDNSIDATDLSATSEPCGITLPPGTPVGPNCSFNTWDSASAGFATLGAAAGLDGNVVTFVGISAGNESVGTTGISWTTAPP